MVMISGKTLNSQKCAKIADARAVDICLWKKSSLTSAYGPVEVPGQGLPSYHKQLENRVKYMKQLFSGIKQQAAQDCGLWEKANQWSKS